MRHFDFSSWLEFVAAERRPEHEALRRHLEAGCESCERLVEMLAKLDRAARHELRPEVPEEAVRAAKALFRGGERPDCPGIRPRDLDLRLVFDSFRQPAPAGTRSLQTSSRHLVYRSPDFALDLRLDYKRDVSDLMVTGQILNRGFGPVPNVPTFLLSNDQIVSRSVAGALGEFHMECQPKGSLLLRLMLTGEESIDISLDRRRPDAAGRQGLPEKQAEETRPERGFSPFDD